MVKAVHPLARKPPGARLHRSTESRSISWSSRWSTHVRLHEIGGPDRLTWEEYLGRGPRPRRGAESNSVQLGSTISTSTIARGFIVRRACPAIIGMEGAGDVVAIGEGVTSLVVGDAVAYAGVLGGYAEERIIAADKLVKVPDGISYETAAAMMLQGMTVRYLLRETFPVTAESVILFHAAAGGVGLIACQWARALGATLIGTVSTDEKAELASKGGRLARDRHVARGFCGARARDHEWAAVRRRL